MAGRSCGVDVVALVGGGGGGGGSMAMPWANTQELLDGEGGGGGGGTDGNDVREIKQVRNGWERMQGGKPKSKGSNEDEETDKRRDETGVQQTCDMHENNSGKRWERNGTKRSVREKPWRKTRKKRAFRTNDETEPKQSTRKRNRRTRRTRRMYAKHRR